MNFLKDLLNDEPYSYDSFNKDELFKRNISRLTSYHYSKSEHYRNYLKGLKFNLKQNYDTHELPFLTIRLFKEFDFFSIKKKTFLKLFIHLEQHRKIYQKFILINLML